MKSGTSAAGELYLSLMSVCLSTPYFLRKVFRASLPPSCIFLSCSDDQASMVTDLWQCQYELKMPGEQHYILNVTGLLGFQGLHLTKLRWTPKPLCLPLHSRHIKMP